MTTYHNSRESCDHLLVLIPSADMSPKLSRCKFSLNSHFASYNIVDLALEPGGVGTGGSLTNSHKIQPT